MNSKVHWSFWVICVVALLWNLMGSINFIVQLNPEMIAGYRESERAIIVGRPIWATGTFAIGVFSGFIGSLLLLLRKHFAFYILILSLAGVGATQLYTLSLGIDFGIGEMIGIVLSPVLVSILLIWYTKVVGGKGWLN